MSRSGFVFHLDFHMLDKHHETCNKEYEDTSGGHTVIKGSSCKLRVSGPSASTFDDPDYDRSKWESFLVNELTQDFNYNLNLYVSAIVKEILNKAEEHCSVVHRGGK